MINLLDYSTSYLVIANNFSDYDNFKSERLLSVLYSKDYTVHKLIRVTENRRSDGYLAIINNMDQNQIRYEILQIIDFLDINEAIIKYPNTNNFVKISKDGSEYPLRITINENADTKTNFILHGSFFNFIPENRYFFPKTKSHLKNGMIVEFYNNNSWISREILDIEIEYNKLYQLLIKYNKLRIPINEQM